MIIWKLPRLRVVPHFFLTRARVKSASRECARDLEVQRLLSLAGLSGPDFSRLIQMESLLVGCSKFFCTYHKCVARHVYSFAPPAPDMLEAPIWKATILGRTDLTTWHANSSCSLSQEIKVLLFLGTLLQEQSTVKSVYSTSTVSKPHARSEKWFPPFRLGFFDKIRWIVTSI